MKTFHEQHLLAALPDLHQPQRFWIAYSGGLDSHVLLVALSRLRQALAPHFRVRLGAIHVHHGLSPHADAWQAHCAQVCRALGLEFRGVRADLSGDSADSVETRARQARYAVFEELLEEGDWLLQGHHQDDQAETLLFRLLRGAGPRGLAGIPGRRALGRGGLCRPLLGFSRAQLQAYAQTAQLQWIEDESNTDTAFDRNFLRHEILPRLEQRWPGFRSNWSRTARLCAEAEQLQVMLGRQDLASVIAERPNRLEIGKLNRFPALRQRNLLRCWFDQLQNQYGLPLPDFTSLQRIVAEVLPAREDACPLVNWGRGPLARAKEHKGRHEGEHADVHAEVHAEVRRHAGFVYALLVASQASPVEQVWELDAPLQLGAQLGILALETVRDNGLALPPAAKLSVRFRRGGERAKPAGRKTRPLKKVLQDYGVPPWLRDQVPLLYLGAELVAVGDLFICEGWQQEQGEGLVRIRWQRSDIRCGY